MLIDVAFLVRKLDIRPEGVLHVGAHKAEELFQYTKYDWSLNNKTIWVEAQPDLALALSERLDTDRNIVINAVAWSEDNVNISFHVTNNGESSSVYELAEHLNKHPQIKEIGVLPLKTIKLSSVLPTDSKFDFVNLDIQGAELQALRGLGHFISGVKWIYTEVNKISLYNEIPLVSEMDDYLAAQGFTRYMTRWVPFKGWGDALFVSNEELRKTKYPNRTLMRAHIVLMEVRSSSIRLKNLSKIFRKPNSKH